MPAWCPGSYLIRDYARFVRDLEARGDDGQPRKAPKVDKQTWRIDTAGPEAAIHSSTRTSCVRWAFCSCA